MADDNQIAADLEKGNSSNDASVVSQAANGAGGGRRKFVRSAVTGSAVLLTLGNRSAWGTFGGGYSNGGGKGKICISTNAMISYRTGNPSSVGRHEKYLEEYEQALQSGNYKEADNSPLDKSCLVPDKKSGGKKNSWSSTGGWRDDGGWGDTDRWGSNRWSDSKSDWWR